MTTQGTNLVDNIVDTQKKVLDTMVENSKKLSGGNNILNETIEKGSEWYKNWLETQKNIFTKATEKAGNAAETVKETTANATETVNETASKMKEFNENWFTAQMNLARQMWEASQEWTKNATNGTHANPFMGGAANPFANTQNNPFGNWHSSMNNFTSPWNSWMNNMQQQNWMNQAQNMNPFNQDAMKKATDTWTNIFNQYTNMLNSNMGDWQKTFQNGTAQDAYKNMVNIGEGFSKFAEMWAPMFKSMQDKTFNMDMYKQWMKPEVYKEMMDKYFGFVPGGAEYMKQMNNMMADGAKHMTDAAMNSYHQARNTMNNPAFNTNQVFGSTLNAYNQWHNMMTEAAAPFTKMMPANQQTKAMSEWSDIANRTMVYNIKNAELQYMIYNQGQKVMDALAENTAAKIKEGKEVNSLIALYQEWLGISDKVFVSLFESEEYSKMMSEVSGMKLKLQKDTEVQMEKMMTGIPVATRSEMDEVYKSIYDLKKQLKDLERASQAAAAEAATAIAAAHAAAAQQAQANAATATAQGNAANAAATEDKASKNAKKA
jgi:hypothetical protein